jgi:glucose/arabinose dehydrogenase
MRKYAQQLDSHLGKILRIKPDGSAPPDNPFVGKPNALSEIWTLGHRNVQAAAFDAQGQYWVVEHGTRGGDELNLIVKGRNYGWPLVAYGEEYSGFPIRSAVTVRPGYEQPVYYWDPVIAPSGAQFYTGDAFPAWRGSLFIGALRERRLVRIVLENGRATYGRGRTARSTSSRTRLTAKSGKSCRGVEPLLDFAMALPFITLFARCFPSCLSSSPPVPPDYRI